MLRQLAAQIAQNDALEAKVAELELMGAVGGGPRGLGANEDELEQLRDELDEERSKVEALQSALEQAGGMGCALLPGT